MTKENVVNTEKENIINTELDFFRLKERYETKSIEISKINPGRRMRFEYTQSSKDWDDFKKSLQERGQIQSIAVMEYKEPYKGFHYFLLAGGRRIKALRELGEKRINATIYPSDLDGFEIRSIELEENIRRKDLTIEEIAKNQRELFDLWTAKYGKKISTSPDAKGISVRDAAKRMGINVMTLSQNLRIADLYDAAPEIKEKVKNRADALKVLDKIQKHKEIEKRLLNMKPLSDIPIDRIRKRIIDSYIVEDFLKGVKKIDNNTIDLINFDPDYPIDTEDSPVHRGIAISKLNKDYNSIENFEEFFKSCLKEFKRIMKDKSWLIIWFGYQYFQQIQNWVLDSGLDISYLHGKWVKNNSHTRNPKRFLGHSIEPFFYARKGTAEIFQPHKDTFECASDHTSKKINDYQKPIKLMEEIFRTFLMPGSKIISPCTGSGNDILGAINSNNICVGFDVNEKQKDAFKLKVYEQEPMYYN